MADLSLLEQFNKLHDRKTAFKDYMSTYDHHEYGFTDPTSYSNALKEFTGVEISKIINTAKHLYYYGNSNDLALVKKSGEHEEVKRIIMYNIYLLLMKEEYSEFKTYIKLHKKFFRTEY